ncbi:hypothetical protein GC425_06340 [Corynebacterium sp. zg254]|uniref:Uncharacterized protein n=1 Tax=Corynebacterium zhongnanshanii TaxID=2768834 RepID=A0ABQ6VDV7_9CORY|nr:MULTISPECIES: hypothetical protein [Corynebacterium]KAB3520862.1 hypothetical protein F8377_06360 [Corynebacterium zhongnanshanii]MCR5914486.1 hypothetical protein [Corynebacterium sp. zg254]
MSVNNFKGVVVASATVMLSLALVGQAVAAPAGGPAAMGSAISAVHDSHYGVITITGRGIAPTSRGLSGGAFAVDSLGGHSIKSTEDGDSFSQVVTIDSVTSPDAYVFDFALPAGFTLEEAPDGGVFFRSSNGEAAGRIKTPWAVDAKGKQVDTYFDVQGNRLVQKVDLSSDLQYPVTADPDGAWGGTKCVAAVTAAIAVPAGAVVKLAKFVKAIGNVKEAIQLLVGATTNAEKLDGALSAAGATASELLGIAAIKDNC